MEFKKSGPLKGEITVPGDKSISHRAVMFGSLAKGTTEITGFLQGADCLSTISCFERMGVAIENRGDIVLVHGNGLHGLKKPETILDCGNSGTTTRLISGILSAQNFDVTLTGDASIQKRPMKRIMEPLSLMGADIVSVNGNGCAPLAIHGKALHGIHYTSKVASAQVKSSILLAGLYAEGPTSVTEPYVSRNHSEIMLNLFGAHVTTKDTTATIEPASELHSVKVNVPGDISSAAYFIAAGLMVPGSEILIKNVGINPTRDGILHVCRAMGADLTLLNVKEDEGEPVADLLVRASSLHGTEIGGSIIPTLIDELPMIAAMACFAEGTTVIRDAAELKVKESNRIAVMVENLSAMGADVTETEDGMIIRGGRPLHGSEYAIIPDQIEAGTYLAAVTAVGGNVLVQNVIPKHMECITSKLQEMGAKVINYDDSIRIMRTGKLRQTTVKTRPYPGFPTDMQAQVCVCMALAGGTSRLTESVYETRFFGYCTELESMGANIRISGKTATVTGVDHLTGSTVFAHDLRAGAALVIAGLAARGTTFVEHIHFIERGYENLVEKLRALGADICRVEDES